MSMRKKLEEYRLVIVDLDGTLYYQRPVRIVMAGRLMTYYLAHPGRIKELFALKKYREIREKAVSLRKQEAEAQYEEAGKELGLSGAYVKHVIEHWMYEIPCRILKRFRDDQLQETIVKLQKKGILVAIYSDYPVSMKLEALELKGMPAFSSEHPKIRRLKPDPKGILSILEQMGIQKQDAVMIGDRREKDGEAAIRAGIDYLILSSCKSKRKKQMKMVSNT